MNNTITDGGVAPQCSFAGPTYMYKRSFETQENVKQNYI